MFAILGSGYGLYGYLPVLAGKYREKIVLPVRYQNRFFSRPELAHFAGDITWSQDEGSCLLQADNVVLALTPTLQEVWIEKCLSSIQLKNMVLEKPLARTPEKSREILQLLIDSGKNFRIGYTFRYTYWGDEFLKLLSKECNDLGSIEFNWQFNAHHYKFNIDNWKRSNKDGGGVIRFYGIHLIALIAQAGYTDVENSIIYGHSSNDFEGWSAEFKGASLPGCKVFINSHSGNNKFDVIYLDDDSNSKSNHMNIHLINPFDDGGKLKHPLDDDRLHVIDGLIKNLLLNQKSEREIDSKIIELWNKVEKSSKFISLA